VGVVDEAVEDGIGDSGLAERAVPVADRELAGDDGGAELVAVLDDLEQIGGLFGCERSQRQVVDDENRDLGPGGHQSWQAPVAPRQAKVLEHARCA
jgi:hypothetical protein